MFSKAYEIASKFTHPLVVTMRFYDKTIDSGLGTFIILNDEGWLMTAAHNLNAAIAHTEHQKEIGEYQEKIEAIKANKQLKENKKKSMIQGLKYNKKWVTDFAILLAGQLIEVEAWAIEGEHDIAFLKVPKEAIVGQTDFPKIIDPTKIKCGTSLCKLGFPFVEVKATFDEATNNFILPPNLLPLPFFPIEGIYSRNIISGKTKDGAMDIMFLETSSPGLKGQSGGPIFDTEGVIYAVQSQNWTVPLGFKGEVVINGRKVEENQFINLGLGVHPQTIVALLKKHKIKFDLAA